MHTSSELAAHRRSSWGGFGLITRAWSSVAGVGLFGLAGLVLGCAGAAGVGAGKAGGRAALQKREVRVVHEPCDLKSNGAEGQDADGDGRPELVRVTVARGTCAAFDLNLDGRWDRFVYQDSEGRVRRTESDFDSDGLTDEIALYNAGQLAEQQRSTTRVGVLDTWHFYKAGLIARTERDSNGDAVVDQWWEYPNATVTDCPVVHSDVDGDGRPDPGASVDMCPPGEAGASSATEESAFDETKPSTLTQTEGEQTGEASK